MMTSADYAELLKDEWHPVTRAGLEADHRRALHREQTMARLSAEAAEAAATRTWQQETLRAARLLLAFQFEVNHWQQRRRVPDCCNDTLRRMRASERGFEQKFARLKREAAEGDTAQQKWMADHAELLAAVTRSGT